MRIGKPCKFEGMAKTWNGYQKWRYSTEGKPYAEIEKAVGPNTLVDVYVETDPEAYLEGVAQNSFKKETLTKMKYSEFLSKSGSSSMSLSMKDSSLKPSLYPLISQPSYLDELTDPS